VDVATLRLKVLKQGWADNGAHGRCVSVSRADARSR
jgi:hypothetical protein